MYKEYFINYYNQLYTHFLVSKPKKVIYLHFFFISYFVCKKVPGFKGTFLKRVQVQTSRDRGKTPGCRIVWGKRRPVWRAR